MAGVYLVVSHSQICALVRRIHLSEPQRARSNSLSYFFHSSAFLLHISLAGSRMHSFHCLLMRKCFSVSLILYSNIYSASGEISLRSRKFGLMLELKWGIIGCEECLQILINN